MQSGILYIRTFEFIAWCIRHILCLAIDIGQTATIRKGTTADGGHTIAYDDGGQAAAIIEGIAADGGNAVGDGDGGQTAAIIEGIAADASHTIGND